MPFETDAAWRLRREGYQKKYRLTHDRKPYDLRYRLTHRLQKRQYQKIYDRDAAEARRNRSAV